jgi:hypothetical protein
MIKQIFIINGSGGVGKDTFIDMIPTYKLHGKGENCSLYLKNLEIKNYSSVSKVKEIAKAIGWNGDKTERDRKFLSDLKILTTEYNDMPLNDMKKCASNFMCDNKVNRILFLHIREPEEIERAIIEFKNYNVKSILVKRDSVKHITSNMADGNVFNFNYDVVIDNSGTLEELREKASHFIDDVLNNTLKTEY